MSYRNPRQQRYANDPVYREKVLVRNRETRKRLKEQQKQRHRVRLATDPEYRKEQKMRGRAEALKSHYGITLEQYDALLEEQGGVCAICGERPEKHLCVDHCHETGTVRGLLCKRCNFGLGYYKDDLRRTMGASAYLRRAQLRLAARKDGVSISDLLRCRAD
jgi:hypothetical protein